MSDYTDNYMTDDKGQRWVKKEYAQTYADRASEAEDRVKALELDLGLMKISLDHKNTLLDSCAEALEERDSKHYENCEYCDNTGKIETDNNGPIVDCPYC